MGPPAASTSGTEVPSSIPAAAGTSSHLALSTLKKSIVAAQYAVRGEIVRRAQVRGGAWAGTSMPAGRGLGGAWPPVQGRRGARRGAGCRAGVSGHAGVWKEGDTSARGRPRRPPFPSQVIANEIEQGVGSKHSFDKVVWCNIGNPHILGQRPITFFRQVGARAAGSHGGSGRRAGGWVGGAQTPAGGRHGWRGKGVGAGDKCVCVWGGGGVGSFPPAAQLARA
jgi:hypothetical protein